MEPVKYVKKSRFMTIHRLVSADRLVPPPPGCGHRNPWGGDAQPSSLPRGLHDKMPHGLATTTTTKKNFTISIAVYCKKKKEEATICAAI